jgi:hypothetical protein
MSLTKVSYSMIDGAAVNVNDFAVNTTPGTTDMTAAINAALATGKTVVIDGLVATTGGHRLGGSTGQFLGQSIVGINGGKIKKLSGTNYVIDTAQGAQVGIRNLYIDLNNLNGNALWWRGHYSNLENVNITNGGSTSYGIRFSAVNLSMFSNVSVVSGGGINIDSSGDPGATGGYSILYSSFKNFYIIPTSNALQAVRIYGQSQNVGFDDLFFENSFDPVASTVPAILLENGPLSAVYFRNLKAEYGKTSAPLIKVDNAAGFPNIECYDIHFEGGRIATGVSGHTGPVFALDSTSQVTIANMQFHNNPNDANRKIVEMYNCKYITLENNSVFAAPNNGFIFIQDNGGNSYVTERGNSSGSNVNYPAEGTNVWSSTSSNVVVERSQYTQNNKTLAATDVVGKTPSNHTQTITGSVTVASSSSYNIWGSQGASASGDFYGLIILGTSNSSSTDKDNFAVFYAQVSSASGTQQFTTISAGANIEIIANPDATDAALALTTNGKLGVQIGYGAGGVANRYVTLFNRLGVSKNINIHVIRF